MSVAVVLGVMTSAPLTALDPLQPPVAAHAVALALDQVRVVVCPAGIVVGLAVKEAVGGGATVTVTDWKALPPAPVHVRVSVVVDVGATGCEPFVDLVPLQPPLAVQAAASVLDQLRVLG